MTRAETTTPDAAARQGDPDRHGATPAVRPARRAGRPDLMPAGRALQIMAVALLAAMVFNSSAMVRAGEGMRPGVTRTMVLRIARPVHAVSGALWLDEPRALLARLVGDAGSPGTSPLLAVPPSPAASRPAVTSSPQPGPTRSRAPSRPGLAPTRRASAAEPLKLVVAGDSMTEFLGPALLGAPGAASRLDGRVDTRYGTGLVRPDFFDWSVEAKRVVAKRHPEAVVVMMGGNDGQGMAVARGSALAEGSASWTAEYSRRARVVMATLLAGGARRVYWVSMPVPRSPRLARDYRQLNAAVAGAAAATPGARAVDVTARLSAGGRYSAYLRDDAGRTVLARARDGIHLTRDGARIAAAVVLKALDADWHVLS